MDVLGGRYNFKMVEDFYKTNKYVRKTRKIEIIGKLKMFEYLKKYINIKNPSFSNSFYPIDEKKIEEQEKRLGIQFPSQLKQFWKEIGCGFLRYPKKIPNDYESWGGNRIASPTNTVDMVLLGQESGSILHDIWEELEQGDLPFFEIIDACRFLVVKTNSDNPNAVYTNTGIKIEDSLEKFIWRLYHENPYFYEDIIHEETEKWKQKSQE